MIKHEYKLRSPTTYIMQSDIHETVKLAKQFYNAVPTEVLQCTKIGLDSTNRRTCEIIGML